nr:transporter substrate-binding domain-containing protein [Sneathiella glossodoripedis]
MRFLLMIPIIFLTCFPAYSNEEAEQVIRISSPELGDGIQTLDNTGIYPDILNALMSGKENHFTFKVLPLRRLIREFQSRQIDCVWALDAQLLNKLMQSNERFLESSAVFNSSHIVITHIDEPKLNDLSELKNKNVALLNGSHMEEKLRSLGAKVMLVPDQDTKIRLIKNRRVDAILAWTPDIFITMKNYSINTGNLSVSYEITATPVRLVCRNSEETDRFIKSVNIAIDKFNGDDTLQKILGHLNIPSLLPLN